MREAPHDRVAHTLQSTEVAKWLAVPTARTLVINGSESEHRPDSATSLFSAMLVGAISRSQPKLPLIYWFCGERLHDPIERMLRGLVAQTLLSSTPEAKTVRPREAGRLDHIGDLTSLLLDCLKAQLEHSPILCVLDGVSFYEDQYRSRELCYVFRKLAALADRRREAETHPLKLLLTSPTRAMDVCDCPAAMDVDVLDLEDDVSGAMYDLDEIDLMQHTVSCLRLR